MVDLVDRAGNVYGTTAAGGQYGDGTVYELTAPNYTYATLSGFRGRHGRMESGRTHDPGAGRSAVWHDTDRGQ